MQQQEVMHVEQGTQTDITRTAKAKRAVGLNRTKLRLLTQRVEDICKAQAEQDGLVSVQELLEFQEVKEVLEGVVGTQRVLLNAIKQSKMCALDAAGLKVQMLENVELEERKDRKSGQPERKILILRNISSDLSPTLVAAIYDHRQCPKVPVSVRSDVEDVWFVEFATEEDCLKTAMWMQKEQIMFNEKPLQFAVKTCWMHTAAAPQFQKKKKKGMKSKKSGRGIVGSARTRREPWVMKIYPSEPVLIRGQPLYGPLPSFAYPPVYPQNERPTRSESFSDLTRFVEETTHWKKLSIDDSSTCSSQFVSLPSTPGTPRSSSHPSSADPASTRTSPCPSPELSCMTSIRDPPAMFDIEGCAAVEEPATPCAVTPASPLNSWFSQVENDGSQDDDEPEEFKQGAAEKAVQAAPAPAAPAAPVEEVPSVAAAPKKHVSWATLAGGPRSDPKFNVNVAETPQPPPPSLEASSSEGEEMVKENFVTVVSRRRRKQAKFHRRVVS